jgi:hypothetical protein
MDKTFKVGDKVKIAKDAKYKCRNGKITRTAGAGYEGVVSVTPNSRSYNYQINVPALGMLCSCLSEYLTLVSEASTASTFKVGDRVKVSEDAKLAYRDGRTFKTDSAGHEGVITGRPKIGERNYLLDVPGFGKNFNCLPEYLSLLSSPQNIQTAVATTPSPSVYCVCNGPAKRSGLGVLVFFICETCGKEKE